MSVIGADYTGWVRCQHPVPGLVLAQRICWRAAAAGNRTQLAVAQAGRVECWVRPHTSDQLHCCTLVGGCTGAALPCQQWGLAVCQDAL